MALHARKKVRQWRDARGTPDWNSVTLDESGAYPRLPPASEAPHVLREALALDIEEIMSGRWRAFGHLPIKVDDPPRWGKDYLADIELPTTESAFKLDHRNLPKRADIKLIWELSRWYQLVRLAMGAYVLHESRAAGKCVEWLEDWVKENPPFRGWNWTSALESGLRLIQFTWISALLRENMRQWGLQERLSALRDHILPPHIWFTWRYRSFGSSANNHLLGEIAGLLVATANWPDLAKWGAEFSELHSLFEEQTLAQFAPDGGNREQALNYQLFSFEFCLHARNAVLAARKPISSVVEQRLDSAMRFFWDVQSDREQWDYGDSDNAFVLPLFLNEPTLVREWRKWMAQAGSPALQYWLNAPPVQGKALAEGKPVHAKEAGEWWYFQNSGIAVCESGLWWLRWDLSPLGYLSTAAHGHLDALHLSVWFHGVPFIIDPGTGAYYADKDLRSWLASRAAHNSPCPPGPEWPSRLGPFLWAGHHKTPCSEFSHAAFRSELQLNAGKVTRTVAFQKGELAFDVEDRYVPASGDPGEFSVRWQFAPGTCIKLVSARAYELRRNNKTITLRVNNDWHEVTVVEQRDSSAAAHEGIVSPAFRQLEWAPYLKLIARPKPGESCVFRTTFVASAAS